MNNTGLSYFPNNIDDKTVVNSDWGWGRISGSVELNIEVSASKHSGNSPKRVTNKTRTQKTPY